MREDHSFEQRVRRETVRAVEPGVGAFADGPEPGDRAERLVCSGRHDDGLEARALPLFERAVRGQPADVTINEHLGDAYWKTGRRYEARYAWRAAAVNAEGEDKARLTAKIENGLGTGRVDH